jgi:hypothetical protein
MAGLNFSLGGKLDPSFKNSLDKAVAESQAAGMRIQSSLRAQIGGLDKQLLKMDPMQPGAAILMDKRASLQKALLIAQNGQFLSAAKQRIALRDAEAVAAKSAEAKLAESAAKSVGHIAGLNMVLRESIVMLRELSRGNFSRMPGSASLIAQGLAQMGPVGRGIALLNKPIFKLAASQAEGAAAGKAAATGFIGALTAIPLAAMAIVAASLAAIIGAPFIYFHRVKKLAAELQTSIVSTFKPEHVAGYLSKLETLNQLHKDVADSARQIAEAHDSVASSIERELDLTRDQISFERELLEAKKQNELAAVKNPAEREAIEKKYSALMLENKKTERAAELKAMQDMAAKLPGEIQKTEDEIKRLTESGGFVGEARDKDIGEMRRDLRDKANDYFKQSESGAKDERSHSADKDRERIAQLIDKQKNGAQMGPFSFTEANKAELAAAQERLKNNFEAQASYNKWLDTADDRTRARERVKELEAKVKKDSDELARLGSVRGGGAIRDKMQKNLVDDAHDLELAKARADRVEAGRPLSSREVTDRQRVGFGGPGVALLDVNRSIDRNIKTLVTHVTKPRTAVTGGNFGTGGTPAGFGD